jgi:Na+-transporting methylmalonyl-CoA/oxaloacetate decarboxylase gamma subunit
LDDMSAGLMITVFGLLLAFTFMGIFIGTIILLQKFFPPMKKEAEETNAGDETPVVLGAEAGGGDEVVAAIAVAVSAMRNARQSELGSALQAGRSTWWISKRIGASQNVGWVKK